MGENPPVYKIRAIASMLDDFYKCVERIFEKIARTVDGKISKGKDWHINLLKQMSEAKSQIRPAVISTELKGILEDYLDLRHVVRHVYGFDLIWVRFEPLAKDFDLVFEEFNKTTKNFLEFLETIIQATQKGN